MMHMVATCSVGLSYSTQLAVFLSPSSQLHVIRPDCRNWQVKVVRFEQLKSAKDFWTCSKGLSVHVVQHIISCMVLPESVT